MTKCILCGNPVQMRTDEARLYVVVQSADPLKTKECWVCTDCQQRTVSEYLQAKFGKDV